jgi:hypothetical protein
MFYGESVLAQDVYPRSRGAYPLSVSTVNFDTRPVGLGFEMPW